MSWDDVGSIFKIIGFILACAIPFIIFGKVDSPFRNHIWVVFVSFPITAIIGVITTTVAFQWAALVNNWTLTNIGIQIILGLYALMTVITSFLQIGYYANSWHWSAWIIGIFVWVVLGIPTAMLFNRFFPKE